MGIVKLKLHVNISRTAQVSKKIGKFKIYLISSEPNINLKKQYILRVSWFCLFVLGIGN